MVHLYLRSEMQSSAKEATKQKREAKKLLQAAALSTDSDSVVISTAVVSSGEETGMT